MTQVDLKLFLPDNLALEAEANGLLTPDSIEALLRDELKRRHSVNQLLDAADRLSAMDLQRLTASEVEAESKAVRDARARLSR